MSIALLFDPALQLVRITVSGQVRPSDFDGALHRLTTDGEFPPNVDAIWDCSAADLSSASVADVHELRLIRANYPQRSGAFTAVVAPTDLAFGMSRMYQLNAESELKLALRVTRTVAEAERSIIGQRAAADASACAACRGGRS